MIVSADNSVNSATMSDMCLSRRGLRLGRPVGKSSTRQTHIGHKTDALQTVLSFAPMRKADLFVELVATYRKHGWQLRTALLQPETREELSTQEIGLLTTPIREARIDALWFSRASNDNREAWELRLMAETQYALFETFEAEETEEQREEVRQEMEARLRDYVLRE